MNESRDSILESQLRIALGSPAIPDFEAWQSHHGDAIDYLDPVVTATYHRHRRLLVRIASAAVAAAIFVAAAAWFLHPQGSTFAQTVNAINKAESVTMTITWYNRMWSQDGKRSWLHKEPRWERSYLAPSRYRDVHYDEDGNIASVDIEDARASKVLHLDMKNKTAMMKNEASGQFGSGPSAGGNPFAGFAKVLEREPIEFVGQRDVQGIHVNVFRYRKEFAQGGHDITDIWLDVKTKRLIGYCNTSEERPFDPETDADRDNRPEKKFSKGTIAGVITGDIVFDAQLDPKLFSLSPPDGFKVVEPKARPKVTEESFIKWLRVSARANQDLFVDTNPKAFLQWQQALDDKPKADRTHAEQEYMDFSHKNTIDGNINVLRRFAEDAAQPRSFHYLGKGAKLGDRDRMICFYKLKGSDKYRAIYGDLTVKDVSPSDLPLPVEK